MTDIKMTEKERDAKLKKDCEELAKAALGVITKVKEIDRVKEEEKKAETPPSVVPVPDPPKAKKKKKTVPKKKENGEHKRGYTEEELKKMEKKRDTIKDRKPVEAQKSQAENIKNFIQVLQLVRKKQVYTDKNNNYHLIMKNGKGPIAPWSKTVRNIFPTYESLLVAYKKASKKGLLKEQPLIKTKAHPKPIELTPIKKKAIKKEDHPPILLRRRKNIEEEPILKRRGMNKTENRNIPEKEIVSIDNDDIFIGKSITPDSIETMYEVGLKAIQNYITNICPKIFVVDVMAPKRRIPKRRFLVESTSPEDALTTVRNENEKKAKSKKLFDEDDVLHLVALHFKSRLTEV